MNHGRRNFPLVNSEADEKVRRAGVSTSARSGAVDKWAVFSQTSQRWVAQHRAAPSLTMPSQPDQVAAAIHWVDRHMRIKAVKTILCVGQPRFYQRVMLGMAKTGHADNIVF